MTSRIQTRLDSNGLIIPLSLEQAISQVPAIAATSAGPNVKSSRYKFTSTMELIGHMDALGYKMVQAQQKGKKDMGFGTHVVKFQSDALAIKNGQGSIESKPTIILFNNHNGSGSVQFEMGLFRLVCSNGLVVKDKEFEGFRERHTRYTLGELRDLIDIRLEGLEYTTKLLNKWGMREMGALERTSFALEAVKLRTDRIPTYNELQDILKPIRKEDEGNDLYSVFNVVQEKLINGGYKLNNRTAKMIKDPVRDNELNKELWQLASSYLS